MKLMTHSKFLLLTAFAMLFSFLPVTQSFAEGLSAPEQIVQDASDKLKVKMQDPGFSKDFTQVAAFVEETIYPSVDFNKMSALVLGKNWKTAKDDEKKRFTQEFQTLLVRTYSRAFLEFHDWTIKFLAPTQEDNANKIIVNTEVLQPGKKSVPINYRMLNVDGAWKAYDITVAGVSLVTTYRSTFNTEIQKTGSLASVIEILEKRNKEALSKNPLAKENS